MFDYIPVISLRKFLFPDDQNAFHTSHHTLFPELKKECQSHSCLFNYENNLKQNLHRITQSQNHTITEWLDLWRSCSPKPLLKQGHPEPVAQDRVQTAFEYIQGWRLHNLSGQPVPVLCHPQSEAVFPDVQREPPVLQLLPITSGPVTWNH